MNFGDWYLLGFLVVFLVAHEFGHYWVAKRQGIFKSVGWMHFMGPCVNLTRPYNSNWDYISGFVFSFLALPMYLIGMQYGWMGRGQLYHFPIIAAAFAAWDIVLIFVVGKTFHMKNKNWFLKFLEKIKLIEFRESDTDENKRQN